MMNYVNNKQEKDFSPIFVRQKGTRECWFACSLMLFHLCVPGQGADYDDEKKAFYQTAAYQNLVQFYKQAGLPSPDPMVCGAGADLLCQYLNERLPSGVNPYHARNLEEPKEKFQAIRASIDGGSPVIIGYKNYHYLIVIGYDDQNMKIAYLDPECPFLIHSKEITDMSKDINELILNL